MTIEQGKIASRFHAGKPLDHIPLIDFHTHLASSADYYFIPRSSSREMVSYLDRFGVDHAVVFPLAPSSDMWSSNSSVFDASEKYPEKFSPLVMLHASFPQDWHMLLKEGYRRGARGVKLISQYQGVQEDETDWSPVFDYIRDKKWVALHHFWGNEERLAHWARTYPEIVFIAGHAEAHDVNYANYKPVIVQYDNVYQCTCAQFISFHCTIESMVKVLPPEKILYGSDAIDLDLGTGIGPIALSGIPEIVKEMILGGNALRLIKQLEWPVALHL